MTAGGHGRSPLLLMRWLAAARAASSPLPSCSMSRRRHRCHWSRPSSSTRRLMKYQDLAVLCGGLFLLVGSIWSTSSSRNTPNPFTERIKIPRDKNTRDDSSCSPPATYSGIEEENLVRISERTAHTTRPRVAGAADPTTTHTQLQSDLITANSPAKRKQHRRWHGWMDGAMKLQRTRVN